MAREPRLAEVFDREEDAEQENGHATEAEGDQQRDIAQQYYGKTCSGSNARFLYSSVAKPGFDLNLICRL